MAMSWIDWTQVAGLMLAAGAALDYIVKKDAKRKIGAWLTRASSSRTNFSYNGSRFLNNFFGEGLLSRKAIIRYTLISLSSVLLSYWFAIVTSPPEVREQITIFPIGFTAVGALILTVCLGFAVLGDIASYSITRLFIRTVDEYRRPIISAGLLVADFITSLSLFFIFFSVSRAISYALVLQVLGTTSFVSKEEFSPLLIEGALREHRIEIANAREDVPGPVWLAKRIVNAKTPKQLETISSEFRRQEIPGDENQKKYKFIEYSAKIECASGSALENVSSLHNSVDLIASAVQASDANADVDTGKLTEALAEKFVLSFNGEKECAARNVVVTRSMPVAGLFAIVGIGDSYLAAFERTLFDAYQVIGFKLAPYVSFDPLLDFNSFVSSLKNMASNTFLGMSPPDDAKVAVLALFADATEIEERELLRVPFSPMVASSLTNSLFFLLYLFAVSMAVVRKSLLTTLGKVAPQLDLKGAPFTSFSLAVLVSGLTLALLVIAAAKMWSLIFI